MDTIKLSQKQMEKLIGSGFKSMLKKIEKDVIAHAKKLSDQKLLSITVTNAGISFDDNSLFVHIQGKWKSGALNYMVRWPLKVGSGISKFLEDVGTIPD